MGALEAILHSTLVSHFIRLASEVLVGYSQESSSVDLLDFLKQVYSGRPLNVSSPFLLLTPVPPGSFKHVCLFLIHYYVMMIILKNPFDVYKSLESLNRPI